jgi:hypothetical protein
MNVTTTSKDKQARGTDVHAAQRRQPAPPVDPTPLPEETDEQPPVEPTDDEPWRMRRPPPEDDERIVHEIPAPLPPVGH